MISVVPKEGYIPTGIMRAAAAAIFSSHTTWTTTGLDSSHAWSLRPCKPAAVVPVLTVQRKTLDIMPLITPVSVEKLILERCGKRERLAAPESLGMLVSKVWLHFSDGFVHSCLGSSRLI